MRLRGLAATLSLLIVSVFGCGGGSGSSPPAATRANVQVRVNWSARSRALDAPSSALSLVITLSQPGQNTAFTWTIDRDLTKPNAYSQTYVSERQAAVGSQTLTGVFYAQSEGLGDVVGRASATITLGADGSGIPPLTAQQTITSVEVKPGQSILVGQLKDLDFTARDSGGNLVAVQTGSAFFTVTDGTERLKIATGQAQGVSPGSAKVTATVDGVVSLPASVQVTSEAVVSILPPTATLPILTTQTFTAQVTKTTNQAVTWSVQETSGGTITPQGLYTAPSLPGTYHIQATSQYDPAKQATATITVQAGSVSAIVD